MARKSNIRQTRDKFIILTNGEQSETNYFNLLKSRKSIYDIEVKFVNADPIGLVDNAEKLLPSANQIWCVFDIDYTYKDKRLLPALNKAKKIGVKIAYSNMAFEVWLISHFQQCEKHLETKDHAEILTKLLKQEGYNLTTGLYACSPVTSSYAKTLSPTSISSIGFKPSSVSTSVPSLKH